MKLKDEVRMAVPKCIQIRFIVIRDIHNYYTSPRLLFSIITDLLVMTCSRHAILRVFLTCIWEKFIFSLSFSFIIIDYLWSPCCSKSKRRPRMYSGCDYPLQILFVYFLTLLSLLQRAVCRVRCVGDIQGLFPNCHDGSGWLVLIQLHYHT